MTCADCSKRTLCIVACKEIGEILSYEEQFPKECSCGRSYDEISWHDLAFAGVMDGTVGERRFYPDLEMRHCHCGSTMAIKILRR